MKEESILNRHISKMEKKVTINQLFLLLSCNSQVKLINDTIYYENIFTGENTLIRNDYNRLIWISNVNNSSLFKYFYKLSKNFIIIEL